MPKHMFEIYLRQRELTYSAGGKLTKNNERIEKFKETEDLFKNRHKTYLSKRTR